MGVISFGAFAGVLFGLACAETFHIQTDEVFAIPLSPSTFNLSDAEYIAGIQDFCTKFFIVLFLNFEIIQFGSKFVYFPTESYSYSASIHGFPDLPKWIHTTYNRVLNMGFLYGTPPNLESTIKVFQYLILSFSRICD